MNKRSVKYRITLKEADTPIVDVILDSCLYHDALGLSSKFKYGFTGMMKDDLLDCSEGYAKINVASLLRELNSQDNENKSDMMKFFALIVEHLEWDLAGSRAKLSTFKEFNLFLRLIDVQKLIESTLLRLISLKQKMHERYNGVFTLEILMTE